MVGLSFPWFGTLKIVVYQIAIPLCVQSRIWYLGSLGWGFQFVKDVDPPPIDPKDTSERPNPTSSTSNMVGLSFPWFGTLKMVISRKFVFSVTVETVETCTLNLRIEYFYLVHDVPVVSDTLTCTPWETDLTSSVLNHLDEVFEHMRYPIIHEIWSNQICISSSQIIFLYFSLYKGTI